MFCWDMFWICLPCLGWRTGSKPTLVLGSIPYGGFYASPTPFRGEGGPKKLTCSRRVRLGCWVGLGANTPCNFWYGGFGIISVINRSTESHRQAFAIGCASEGVAGAARRSRRPRQQALGTPPHLRLLRTPPNHHYPECILRTTPRFSLDQYPRRDRKSVV